MAPPPPYHHLLPLIILSLLLHQATPAQFSITGFDPDDLRSETRVAELFQQWREKHGKVYTSTKETSNRFETFKRNLEYVVEMNGSNRTGHMVGLNRFADLSNEEFRERYMGLAKVQRPVRLSRGERIDSVAVAKCDAPPSLDWREKGVVTPVKDQGQCGACWAFSATGATESINAINTGELVSLSEQELLDCDRAQQGCDGGVMDKAFKWIIRNGLETEDEYPYRAVRGACNALNGAEKISIDGYEDVLPSESALLCALLSQPISVGIDGSSRDFQLYSGGIYEGDCSSNPNDLNHAALLVGYDSENGKDYWIVKNSWGTYWGINGYIYIRRNTKLPYGVCAINAMASFPTQFTNSSPPFPSPVSPPPPTPPRPSECGNFAYCPADQTCCCIFKFFGLCLVHGCCPYKEAVCCAGTDECCPSDYPVCDISDGFCTKKPGDYLGVAAKKKKLAKYKFLRYNDDEQIQKDISDEPLQWRNQFAALR